MSLTESRVFSLRCVTARHQEQDRQVEHEVAEDQYSGMFTTSERNTLSLVQSSLHN